MHELHIVTCLSQFTKLHYQNYEFERFYPMPGGGYVATYIDPEPTAMRPIRIATTQLQCPVPPASMHFSERYMQAKNILAALSGEKNVLFGGDMSWDDKADLPFPLPEGWVDAACSFGTTGLDIRCSMGRKAEGAQ
jgi:tyrosyl-DNA phosphodiesterase 2